MTNQHSNGSTLPWIVVLAGGSGRRLQTLTKALTGYPTPKQFCSFGRRGSLLQETLTRARTLGAPTRTVVVANTEHLELARRQLAHRPGVSLIEQPMDRGTAPGVLLPLVQVHRRDPDATVILLPSDHGIARNDLFAKGIDRARRAVKADPSLVVIGGVQADRPSTDFGWIVPAMTGKRRRPPCLWPIHSFVEKPPRERAERLYRDGGLWSTFIIVARSAALLDLFRTHLPDLTAFFETYARLDPTPARYWLRRNYACLPAADFSADFLSRLHNSAVLSWPVALGWADLGTPERLIDWLARQGDVEPRLKSWAARAGHREAALTASAGRPTVLEV
jgi:mannose-1-phosphate guanylyltransferase